MYLWWLRNVCTRVSPRFEFMSTHPNQSMYRPITNERENVYSKILLKYGSEEKGSSFCKCSILLGFITYVKKTRELLSEDKIANLLVFLT